MSDELQNAQSSTGAPDEKPRGLARLHILGRLLWLCFHSVAMVVLGNVLFFLLPQVREGLWAFDDGAGDTFHRQAFFVLAFLYWAATTWYVARLTLARDFEHDTVGCTDRFTHQVAKWLPRLLSAAACLPLAMFLLGTGRHVLLSLVLVLVSALFLAFTWLRRDLVKRAKAMQAEEAEANPGRAPGAQARVSQAQVPQAQAQTHGEENNWAGGAYYRYSEKLGRGAWRTLCAGFAVPHLVLLFVWLDPIATGRFLGAPTLILLAIGAWALVGGMLLSYAPRTQGWVTLNWVPVVAFIAFAPFNDNHPIDWQAGSSPSRPQPDEQKRTDARPLLKDYHTRFMAGHPEGQPVYFIASAGGASRASYWAGLVLGGLEDQARAHGGRFGRNVHIMSGVSGGSVGIGAYAAALAAWPEGSSGHCIRLAMDRMLGEDVLSPVGAMMLFPDLLQRLSPVASQAQDRSRGLEAAWTADWQRLMAQPPAGCPKPSGEQAAGFWKQPLAGLARDKHWPALVLNTARLEDGRRVLQSNVRFDLRDADDLLAGGFEARARGISLAGAAHNSARFPLVSPPGTVRRNEGEVWGHLGDGGYHEVTGSATLADIIEVLIADGCLYRTATALHARRQCVVAAEPAAADARVVVLMLDNTPSSYPKGWLRDADGQALLWPLDEQRSQALRPAAPLSPIEALGPVVGLLSLNGQVGRAAELRLAALAGSDPSSLIELRLPRYRGLREPSMNWQLDRESRGAMTCAAWGRGTGVVPVLSVDEDGESCQAHYLPRPGSQGANLADEALGRNLERLRKLMVPAGKPPAPAPGAVHARFDPSKR